MKLDFALARHHQLLRDVRLGADAPQYNFNTLVMQAAAIELHADDLRWFDWGRYSRHQQQEMQLGGLLGAVTLRGELAPFAELLHLGQWLHVGKTATMGLGGYRLELAWPRRDVITLFQLFWDNHGNHHSHHRQQ